MFINAGALIHMKRKFMLGIVINSKFGQHLQQSYNSMVTCNTQDFVLGLKFFFSDCNPIIALQIYIINN